MTQAILITGVGQRLGLALAQELRGKGYQVIGTYRTVRKSIAALKEQGVELHRVDFNDATALHQFTQIVLAKHQSLRAIIHNASEWLPDQKQVDGDHYSVIDRMLKVHVHAPYIINIELAAALQRQHGMSDIIHISDYAASTGSAKHAAYTASKAALENLTQSFALKYAPKVKVNAIAPALVLFNQTDSAQYRQKALQKALIPKECGVQEMLASVHYLLQSEYITGRILPLDGGRHLASRR